MALGSAENEREVLAATSSSSSVTAPEESNNLQEEEEEDEEMMHYKKKGLSVVTFRIVSNAKDLETPCRKSNSFQPEMCHQIFGDNEIIFGYRQVSINLYYLHNSARCYLDLKTSGTLPETECQKADNIEATLGPWLPAGFRKSKEEFLRDIENEVHDHVFGEEISSFENAKDNKKYKITLCDVNDEAFREFHRRFETYIVWFIDGANMLDLDEGRWIVFYVYEEYEDEHTKHTHRSPVAFCTVFEFYLHPDRTRPRISQFFVLPTHQRRGIATHLYAAVFNHLERLPRMGDVTVEEPTPVFQQIRDYSDCLRVIMDDATSLDVAALAAAADARARLAELCAKFKFCKKQAQRVADILTYVATGRVGLKECGVFLKMIKGRFTAQYERANKVGKRFCNMQRLPQLAETVDKDAVIDRDYKRYIESLEVPVNRIKIWLIKH